MADREVPSGIVAQQVVLAVPALIACLLLSIGQIFAWVFVPRTDVAGLWEWRDEPTRSTGTVVDVSRTSVRVNGRQVYAVSFQHDVGDARLDATSYGARGAGLHFGDRVDVEYPPRRPDGARIVGLERRLFPPAVVLAPALPLLIGLALLIAALIVGLRRVVVLRRGDVVVGELVAREATMARVNRKRVYRLRLRFHSPAGEPVETVVRTHRLGELGAGAQVPLLHDRETGRTVLVDALPGGIALDADGRLGSRWPAARAFAFVLPAVAIGGWVVFAVFGMP
jgi:hypothetical protein